LKILTYNLRERWGEIMFVLKNQRLSLSCLSLIVFLGTPFLTACDPKSGNSTQQSGRAQSTPAVTQAAPSDGVRRVTVQELRDALEKGEAVVVDVRGPVEYDLGHIKGALSVPLGLIAEKLSGLPRDKLIVTYCA
jgi:Rhodanese-like domain